MHAKQQHMACGAASSDTKALLLQLFPYHLSEYVCRVLRVTPFKYYCDLLYTVMREEKSYDQIPNFAVRILLPLLYTPVNAEYQMIMIADPCRCIQAADIVQLVGIGRNEYIAIMNKCKAKKLLWRVNKSIAKEFLPTTPLDVNMQPWWNVGVVNLSKPPCDQFLMSLASSRLAPCAIA